MTVTNNILITSAALGNVGETSGDSSAQRPAPSLPQSSERPQQAKSIEQQINELIRDKKYEQARQLIEKNKSSLIDPERVISYINNQERLAPVFEQAKRLFVSSGEKQAADFLKTNAPFLGQLGFDPEGLLRFIKDDCQSQKVLDNAVKMAEKGDFSKADEYIQNNAAFLSRIGRDAEAEKRRLRTSVQSANLQKAVIDLLGQENGETKAKELIALNKPFLERQEVTESDFLKHCIKVPQFETMNMQLQAKIDIGDFDGAREILKSEKNKDVIGGGLQSLLDSVKAAEIKHQANTLVLDGKKQEALKLIEDNKSFLMKDMENNPQEGKTPDQMFTGLVSSINNGVMLSVKINNEWAVRQDIDMTPKASQPGPSREVMILQKLLKETAKKDGMPYLETTHVEDGITDASTFFAIYDFVNRGGKELTYKQSVEVLSSVKQDSQNREINIDAQLIQDVKKECSKQSENAYLSSVRTQIWSSKLGELIRQNFEGVTYDNICWYAVEYIKAAEKDPASKNRLEGISSSLFGDGNKDVVMKADDFEFLMERCGTPVFDAEMIAGIDPPKTTDAKVCLSKFTLRAIDIDEPLKAKKMEDVPLAGQSVVISRSQFGASNFAQIALFKDTLKRSGVLLPSIGRGTIVSDYFTPADIDRISDFYGKDTKPFIQYNLKNDPELRAEIKTEAEKQGDAELKTLLSKIASLETIDKAGRVYVSPEEFLLFRNYVDRLQDGGYRSKMQLVAASIRSEMIDGLTKEEIGALKELPASVANGRITLDVLMDKASVNKGAAALVRLITIQNSTVQDMRNEWWAVAPAMASRPGVVAGNQQITAWKTLYAQESGMQKKLEDLNVEIASLKSDKSDPAKMLSLTAERDAIYLFLTNSSITPEFYRWMTRKYNDNKGYIKEAASKTAAWFNKSVFGAYIVDSSGAKKDFSDAIHQFLTADSQIRQIGSKKLEQLWDTRGFQTLNPSGIEFDGLGLTPEQLQKVNDIKQSLSVFIMVTFDPIKGTITDHPIALTTWASIKQMTGVGQIAEMLGFAASSNSVKTELKMLCREQYGMIATTDPQFFDKYRENMGANAANNELTYKDLQLLKRFAEMNALKKSVIDNIQKIIDGCGEYRDGRSVPIEPGSEAYEYLVDFRNELVKSSPVNVGDQYAADIRQGVDRSGWKGYFGELADPLDAWKKIWDKASEEDKRSPVMAETQKIWESCSTAGEVGSQFFAQQVNLRVLMPYYIYLGLPAQAVSMFAQSMTGRASWSESFKTAGKTAFGMFLYRYPPMWYKQVIQEAKDEHYASAVGMLLATNFFTMMGGYNSIWGRAFQPYSELVRLASKIPGLEQAAKMMPGVGSERRAYERLGAKGVSINIGGKTYKLTLGKAGKYTVNATLNQAGALYEWIKTPSEESGSKRKYAQKRADQIDYGIDYAAAKPGSLITRGKQWADDRIQQKRLRQSIADTTGRNVGEITGEQEALALEFTKKGGTLIFGDNTSATSVRLTNGEIDQINPTGEGSLRGLMEIEKMMSEAGKGTGTLGSLYDEATGSLKLDVSIDNNSHRLAVTEVRMESGIGEPYYIVKKPSGITEPDMYEIVLILPEGVTGAQVDGLFGSTPRQIQDVPQSRQAGRENPVLQGDGLPSVESEDRAYWQGNVPTSYRNKKGEPYNLHDNQIQAMKLITQQSAEGARMPNLYLNVGCGQGKTGIGIISAMDLSKQGIGTHVVTSNDALVDDWAIEARRMGLKEGVDFGVIKQGMTTAQKRAAYKCPIVVGADQMIFDAITGEFTSEKIGRDRKQLITDESDQKLIDTAETAYFMSGDAENVTNPVILRQKKIEHQKKWMHSRNIYIALAKANTNDSLIKDGKLTEAGIEFVKTRAGKGASIGEEISRIEKIWLAAQVVAQKKAGGGELTKKYKYEVRDGKIVIINSEGYPMYGQRWEGGIDEALCLAEGLQIEAPQSTLSSITYKKFMSLYKRNVGFSGTNREDWGIIKDLYPDMQLAILDNYLPEFELKSDDLRSPSAARQRAQQIIAEAAVTSEKTIKIIVSGDANPILLQEFYKELELGLKPEIEEVSIVERPAMRKAASTRAAKLQAIAENTVERLMRGQPVLVSCTEISDVEALRDLIISELDKQPDKAQAKKMKKSVRTLTAQNVGRQGIEIVKNAGKPGACTIATTAARGTDVSIDPRTKGAIDLILDGIEVDQATISSTPGKRVRAGGLHVQLVEQDTNMRLTTQKENRSARQADPGSSTVWISAEDHLFSVLAPQEKTDLEYQISTGNNSQVQRIIDDCLEKHRSSTREQIAKANFFSDAVSEISSGTVERPGYDSFYDSSTKGNDFVSLLARDTASEILRLTGKSSNEILTTEDIIKMQSAMEALLRRGVDIDALQGMKAEVAERALRSKISEVYERRYGRDASFNNRAMTDAFVPGKDAWTQGVQNILTKNRAAFEAELKTIQEEIQGSMMSVDGNLEEVFRQRANQVYDRMMNNIRKDLFEHLFRTRTLSKATDAVYKLGRLKFVVSRADAAKAMAMQPRQGQSRPVSESSMASLSARRSSSDNGAAPGSLAAGENPVEAGSQSESRRDLSSAEKRNILLPLLRMNSAQLTKAAVERVRVQNGLSDAQMKEIMDEMGLRVSDDDNKQSSPTTSGGQAGPITQQQANAIASAGTTGTTINAATQLFDGLLNHPQMVSAEARSVLKGGIKVLADREFNKVGIRGDAVFVEDAVYVRRSAVQTGRDGNLTAESGQRLAKAVLHELSEVHVRVALGEQGAEAAHEVGIAAEGLTKVRIEPTKARKVANAAKSMALSGAIFTVMGTAIELLPEYIKARRENKDVDFKDIEEKAFGNFAGVTEFNLKTYMSRPFLGAKAGGFVFKYDMLRSMTDTKSAALGVGNFAGFEAGMKLSQMFLKWRGINNPVLSEGIGVGLGLGLAKAGELGTQAFGDRFNVVYENPFVRGTLALGSAVGGYDPGNIITGYFGEHIGPLTVMGRDLNPLSNGMATIGVSAAEYKGVRWAASKLAASKPVVQAAEKIGTTGGKILATSAGAALFAGVDGYDQAKKYEGRQSGLGGQVDAALGTGKALARGAAIGAATGTVTAVGTGISAASATVSAGGGTLAATGAGLTAAAGTAGTILSATGIGTVAAGAALVGGAGIMIIQEGRRTTEGQIDSMSNEQLMNFMSGIKLAQSGWVSGINIGNLSIEAAMKRFRELPENVQKNIIEAVKVRFPDFPPDQGIWLLSRIGFANPVGNTIPSESKNGGWKSLGSDFSMINDVFKGGDWKGSYKDEQEFLDVNVPNWRFLVSQYSGQRGHFEAKLYSLFASETVQNYIKLIDEKGFVPRNIAIEYISNPELIKLIPPSEFWAKSGMTNELSQDEINKLVEESKKA